MLIFMEMALEDCKWLFAWASHISSRRLENDTQQPSGNEGTRNFQMYSISTPTGRPPPNVADRRGP